MSFEMKLGKEWIIERRYISNIKPQPDEWGFHHVDYDGPEDNRCGFGTTLDDIYRQIDELKAGS